MSAVVKVPEPAPGSLRYVGRLAILGIEFADAGNLHAAEVLIGEKLLAARAQAFEDAIELVHSWGVERQAECEADGADLEQSEFDEHAANCATTLVEQLTRLASTTTVRP